MINQKLNKYTRKIFNTTDSSKLKFYKQKIGYYRNLQQGGADGEITKLQGKVKQKIADVKKLHETSGQCAENLATQKAELNTLSEKYAPKKEQADKNAAEINKTSLSFSKKNTEYKNQIGEEKKFLDDIIGLTTPTATPQEGGVEGNDINEIKEKRQEFMARFGKLQEQHEGSKQCAEDTTRVEAEIAIKNKEIGAVDGLLVDSGTELDEEEKKLAAVMAQSQNQRKSEIAFLKGILGESSEPGPIPPVSKKDYSPVSPSEDPLGLQAGGCGGGTCGIPLPSFGRVG